MRVVVLLSVAVATLLCASVSSAQVSGEVGFLMGRKPKPFIDPAGYWAAVLPEGFDCETRPRHVSCKGNRGAGTLLTVDVVDVPPSATADLAMLNQVDLFKKKPHFKLLQRGQTHIDGTPALTASFSYDYMKNVEYAVGVQELVMVRSGKLYVLHFEGRLDQFGLHKRDLELLYGSFRPAALDAGGNPLLDDLRPRPESDSSEVDQAQRLGY